MDIKLRILETPEDMMALEEVQRQVWGTGDVIPNHLLITFAHNGGLLIGAFAGIRMVGFVFGFPGLITAGDGFEIKHCSHMLAVLPDFRSHGTGYMLKRAQWQMIRRQGIDRITWTYDPLMSRNAYLNIAKLGAVSNTYFENLYGEMDDDLNRGLPSDRLQVDLWVNSARVSDRMSKRPRRRLDLAHYLSAGAEIINPTRLDENGWPQPPDSPWLAASIAENQGAAPPSDQNQPALFLLEIPSDFLQLKVSDPDLALKWRLHTRVLFKDLFTRGYLATDLIFLRGDHPRSFYVFSHGERTLGE